MTNIVLDDIPLPGAVAKLHELAAAEPFVHLTVSMNGDRFVFRSREEVTFFAWGLKQGWEHYCHCGDTKPCYCEYDE